MLRGCVIDFWGSWKEYLPLAKFAYNNSFQSSIQNAPYEALRGRKCSKPLCWTNLRGKKVLRPNLVQEIENTVRIIQDHLRSTWDRQNSYFDLKRKDIGLSVSDQVFLKVSYWKKVLRLGCKGKLSSTFIRNYHIIKRVGPVPCHVELPPELDHIHDVFSCVHVEAIPIWPFSYIFG